MKYKLNSNGGEFTLTVGSSRFNLLEPKDIVELSYDPNYQVFTANIKEPSNHTLYLLNEGLLGIALCKLNTGVSQRNHMCKATEEGYRESFYVKKHYHPRWSKCGYQIFPIDSLNNIRIPVSDFGSLERFKPNQKHTLSGEHSNWFTYIKATLISRGQHSLGMDYPYEAFPSDRAYKTYSNRIGIRYVEADDEIVPREKTVRRGFIATQIAPRTFRISFQNLSSYWMGNVDILMAVKDISNMHSHGEYKHRYEEDQPDDYRLYGVENFIPYHGNESTVLDTVTITSNDDYFDVTLPDLSEVTIEDGIVHPRVYHAYKRAVKHNFSRGAFTYNSRVYIQIRKCQHDSKMPCINTSRNTINYDTNLSINILEQ